MLHVVGIFSSDINLSRIHCNLCSARRFFPTYYLEKESVKVSGLLRRYFLPYVLLALLCTICCATRLTHRCQLRRLPLRTYFLLHTFVTNSALLTFAA